MDRHSDYNFICLKQSANEMCPLRQIHWSFMKIFFFDLNTDFPSFPWLCFVRSYWLSTKMTYGVIFVSIMSRIENWYSVKRVKNYKCFHSCFRSRHVRCLSRITVDVKEVIKVFETHPREGSVNGLKGTSYERLWAVASLMLSCSLVLEVTWILDQN